MEGQKNPYIRDISATAWRRADAGQQSIGDS
jgi:hypothetical protein